MLLCIKCGLYPTLYVIAAAALLVVTACGKYEGLKGCVASLLMCDHQPDRLK